MHEVANDNNNKLLTRLILLGVVLAYAGVKLLHAQGGLLFVMETGLYHDLCWKLGNGRGWYSSMVQEHFLSVHFSPAMLWLAMIYKAWASPQVLLLSQGLAVGLTVIPLTMLMKEIMPRHATSQWLLWAAFALYGPIHFAWAGGFDAAILGLPMLAAAVYTLHQRQKGWLAFWCVCLLTTHESAAISLICLGLYAGLCLKQRLSMILLMLSGGLIYGLIIWQVMPSFANANTTSAVRFELAILKQPMSLVKYALLLLLPLGLLPLFGWRVLIVAMPAVGYDLFTHPADAASLWTQHHPASVIFLLLAAMHGMNHLHQNNWLEKRRLMAIGCAIWGVWAGALRGPTLPEQAMAWWPNAQAKAWHAAIEPYRSLPEDQAIAGDSLTGTWLCERDHFVLLHVDETSPEGKAYPDLQQLQVGQLLILSPQAADHLEIKGMLLASGRVERVEQNAHLIVYRWQGW